MEEYFDEINKNLEKMYKIADAARKKGFEPIEDVEIPLAKNMAERVVGIISIVAPQIKNSGIIERIDELEKEYGAQDWRVAFKLAEEVAKEKFCKFSGKKEAMEVGIRVGIAYITVGVVASPIEGFVELKFRKRRDGKDYIALFYSGPIRSAGGTAGAVSVLIADYVRCLMGIGTYDASDVEIKRTVTELYDYHEKVTNLQYLPSEEEIKFLAERLPVQIDGDPSEDYEVSNYKDLDRVETNRIRNGVCLVIGECLCSKAPKLWKQLSSWGKDFGMEHWGFLEEFVKMQKKLRSAGVAKDESVKISPDYNFIKDIVAGRPVLTYPMTVGGFRLRYGRTRTSGFSSDAIHPATMVVLDNYIAIGTQLKTERPGKSTVISACDRLEGPIVKLKNGDVVFVEDKETAIKVKDEIEEILFLGDLLINYGDFYNRAHKLVPCGYNEEWHLAELKKMNCDDELVKEMIMEPYGRCNMDDVARLAIQYDIPLHPRYTYHWKDINYEQFMRFVDWYKNAKITSDKVILPLNDEMSVDTDLDPKRVLELLGVPHRVVAKDNVVIEGEDAKAIAFYFRHLDIFEFDDCKEVLKIVNKLAGVKIRDKSGTFIGARMGRPEKAKMRKLIGSPQVLFPVGREGGKMRNLQESLKLGKVTSEFPLRFCLNCNKGTIYSVCEDCGEKTAKKYYCFNCKQVYDEPCKMHESVTHSQIELDVNHYFRRALGLLDAVEYNEMIKGVRGMSNEESIPEHLVKGILRSKNGLYVNKDGTIRYDMTEMVITHFKPVEIGTSIEKLRELGYHNDINGKDIENGEQIIELKCQDVILPSCKESLEEGCDEVLFRISKFIDQLLVCLYKQGPFYNLKNKNDLVGHYVVAMSPHTSAGIVARIIGFSNTQGFFAHPLLHSIMRRDCLGSNNYISVKENGCWSIKKIGDYVISKNPDEKVDNYGTLKKNITGSLVWSNPGEGKIKEVTKHDKRKLVRLSLEDGRMIDLTESHKVYLKGKTEKRAGDVKVGDKLVVSYKKAIEEKDIEELFLPEIFKGRKDVMLRGIKSYLLQFEKISKQNNFCFRDSFPIDSVECFLARYGKSLRDIPSSVKISIKRDNVCLPIRIPFDEELLEVMGLYIAEGYSRANKSKKGFYQLSISNSDKYLKSRIKEVFNLYFNLKPSGEKNDALTFSSRLIYELFGDYFKFGRCAREKRIPSILLDLKKNKIAALLRGYFEGDGSVSLSDIRVCCDTISEGLRQDLSFVLARFGIFVKFYEYEKEPGPKVRQFYLKKNRIIPKFRITKVIIPSDFVHKFKQIDFMSKRKKDILRKILISKPYGMRIDYDETYAYPKVRSIKEIGVMDNYCLNILNEHNFFANDILVHNCDGDEACVILLMDALLNFSRKYLPNRRGVTQDAPLVLTSTLIPKEVDNMVFDMDIAWSYPLELYEAALEYKNPWDVKIERFGDNLGTPKEYCGLGFTIDTSNINDGARCSAYKSIPSMMEKVRGQMNIAEKVRAVNENDVARLLIDRHFIRDIRGNLRKFSQQQFRCVDCNEKYRRPPLIGRCLKCNGRLIFTVAEGSIIKYLEPSFDLAQKYTLPPYINQVLQMTRKRIESIFGRDDEKQEGLKKWF